MKAKNKQNIFAAAFVGALSLIAATVVHAADKKPNIVFILTDNLGYGEVGCYGGGLTRGAATPRIDSLAKQGLRLLNMNMETQCTPSRASLMTGRWAIRSGCHSVPFGGVADGLTRWEVTIGEALADAGYVTGYYGKWHLGSFDGRLPNDQGFDEWYGIPRTTDEARWPSSPGWSPDIMPAEHTMEGKKGGKSRELKTYDVVERRLIDAEITRRSVALIEREAALKQISEELSLQRQGLIEDLEQAEAPTRKILADTRTALEAGAQMSTALDGALKTLDTFLARFDTPPPPVGAPPPPPPAEPGKPFDITEYGETATRLTATLHEINTLAQTLDHEMPQVERMLSEAEQRGTQAIDHAFRRGLQLGAFLIAAVALAVLTVRWISARLARADAGSKKSAA